MLGVDELVEGDNTVTGEEAVVGGDVQTRAWATDVVLARSLKVMGGIAWGWNLVTALAVSLLAVGGIVVPVWCYDANSRLVDVASWDVVTIASGWSTRVASS